MAIRKRNHCYSWQFFEELEQRHLLAAIIEGRVWFDVDQNGLQGNENEYEVADVTVHLLDQAQNVEKSTSTDRNGIFEFIGVASGTYALELILPDGTAFSPMDAGGAGNDFFDSDFDPVTGLTELFSINSVSFLDSLAAGVFSIRPTSTIRGRVWNDFNGDGVQDSTEPGIPNSEVQLENTLSEKLISVWTDELGNYQFDPDQLLPGDYLLDFVRPPRDEDAGEPRWEISPRLFGDVIGESLNSDASSENGKTEPFTLLAAEVGMIPNEIVLDAGFFRSARLSGRVWHDVDRNGLRGQLEWGVSRVTVNLLNNNLELLSTTKTDLDGKYEFRGLEQGEYILDFEIFEGLNFSERNLGEDDQLDSDVLPATGNTRLFRLSNSDHVSEIDAGLYSDTKVNSIHGRVWHDWDADGVQDPDEPGIASAEVQLENDLFNKLLEVNTDDLGEYRIEGEQLLPGTYLVDFKRPPREEDEDRWQISPRNIDPGIDPSLDNDAQPTNGKSPPLTLSSLQEGDPNESLERDAGFFRFGRISGTVWDDINKDGLFDEGESLVAGVEVQLIDSQAEIVGKTQTDKTGRYLFQEIIPGVYSLQFSTPFSTNFSPLGENRNDQIVNDVDPSNKSTSMFSVRSDEEISKHGALHGTQADSVIGGVTWDDQDGNGIRESSESRLAGIEVHLLNVDSQIILTTTTAENGEYRFINPSPGFYAVQFIAPSGTTFSPINRGDDDTIDSDVSRWSSKTSHFSLLSGQHQLTQDVAIYRGPLSTNTKDSLRVSEVGFIAHGQSEFTEIKNIGEEPVDLRGVRFTRGVRFDFTNSTITSLFPGEHAVVLGPGHSLAERFNLNEINVAGFYSGDLDRDERLTLVDASDEVINSFRYDDDWFVIMDNEYLPWTLTVIDEHAEESAWQYSSNWRPSSDLGGTPGSDDPKTLPDPGSIVINEVLTKSSDGFNDLIEIHNTTEEDFDISDWYIGDSNQEVDPLIYLTRYRIAPGTVIPAGGYLVFSREDHFANPHDPGTNTPFGLSSFGESVHLIAANQYGRMLGYSDSFSFNGTQIDVSFGRYLNLSGEVVVSPTTENTFGSANAPAQMSPVVIDEIMYNATPAGDEYIRLLNLSDQDIDLSAGKIPWAIDDAIDYLFPLDAKIAAGGSAYVVPSTPITFREKYNIENDVPIFGPYSGQLNNGGEDIRLIRHDDDGRPILIDQVNYDDQPPWPKEADFGDISLVRISATEYGNDPVNWTHSAEGLEPKNDVWNGDSEIGTPGDGMTWDDPNNWTSNDVVDVAPVNWPFGDNITLGPYRGAPIITLGDDIRVNSLAFESSFTLTGEPFLLTSGIIDVKAGATATIDTDLISLGPIHKTGEGTLIINGAVDDIELDQGQLDIFGSAGRINVVEGFVNVAGSALRIEGHSADISVDGQVNDIRIDVGDVSINGSASNVRIGSGSLFVGGTVGNLVVSHGNVVVDGAASSITVADGALIVNGTARSTVVETGSISGSGELESLRVGPNVGLESTTSQDNFNVNGFMSIEGKARFNIDSIEESNPIRVEQPILLFDGSSIELQVNNPLEIVGEVYVELFRGSHLGRFIEAPAAGEHLGYGIFIAIDEGKPGIAYENDSIGTVLKQAVIGDVDGDGDIDPFDITALVAAGKFNLPDEDATWTEGDFNQDGRFDPFDVIELLKSIARQNRGEQ